jgi:RNA polymerase sigma-70 factor (ECF subfamily)
MTKFSTDPLAQELTQARGSLLRAARARLSNPEWADDAVSETLLAALEARPRIPEPARLRAWLFGVLRHKVVDQLRLHLSESLQSPAVESQDASAGADPPRSVANRQFVLRLAALLAVMPPRQAQAFLMCHALGHSTDEVCAELGLSPGALWVSLHRTRTRLQQGLVGHRD